MTVDLRRFLARAGLSVDELRTRALEALDVVAGESLFVAGSLVEGLGNWSSDVDLYLLTRRGDLRFTSALRTLVIDVGPFVCDVNVFDLEELEGLLTAFETWAAAPRSPRAVMAFDDKQRRMLHRLWASEPLVGDDLLAAARERVSRPALARMQVDRARHYATHLQLDLAGMHRAGDWLSMAPVAQELLGHAADALLGAHGSTNPSPKWRVRLLDRIPPERGRSLLRESASTTARCYLTALRMPADDSEFVEFSRRIVHIARVAIAWSEHRLLGPGQELALRAPPPRRTEPRDPATPRLPELDFDVLVRFDGERFELGRAAVGAPAYGLSDDLFCLLQAFDGHTSRTTSSSPELVHLLGVVEHGGLAAREVADERLLSALLGANEKSPGPG